MPLLRSQALTVKSTSFDPAQFLDTWPAKSSQLLPHEIDFRTSIIHAFGLKEADDYVYHAVASVTLAQVQHVISRGPGENGMLLAWYRDSERKQLPPPPSHDIEAYTSVFASTTSTTKALIGLEKNAKKDSIRESVAAHLISLRQLPSRFKISKLKTPHTNPYYDYWQWSCQYLQWAGPNADTVRVHHSHHILPILYHHFGCVCPSYESLEIIKQISKVKPVIEIGSGNGYWAFLLRRLGVEVQAVDNVESKWRTTWIADTIVADGAAYLTKHQGCKDTVLLMVYPVARSGFTASILESYTGDVVCVVGTQNRNGYTGFKDTTIEEYVGKKMAAFEKTVQIPLPSFAGKDDALFVFERRE